MILVDLESRDRFDFHHRKLSRDLSETARSHFKMSSEESIFEDGENLQAAIGKALAEKKALLCFISDDGDDSTQWQVALLDEDVEEKMRSSTVVLRLQAGSEQAGFLSAVCPINNVPAVVIIYNAQVIANFQHGQTSFEEFEKHIKARYGASDDPADVEPVDSSPAQRPRLPGYLDLPSSDGRMRLPNNAYDHLRKLTQQYLDSGVSGKALLQIQLRLLESLNIDIIKTTVDELKTRTSTTEPSLPEQVTNRLLNTPASSLQTQPTSTPPTNTSRPSQPVTNPQTSSSSQSPSARSHPRPSSSQPQASSNNSSTAASQRSEYITAQKAAEAERARIKAQIEADKRARREADRKAREEAETERRRTELYELRKANSTTADPKATDVRIQVRLFDGGTIRNSFPAESTIAKDLRPWIDEEVKKKAQGVPGQPYNLKLILTPLPNRSIEAGEEDQALVDLEGIKGSATLVLVPVRTFVESYGDGSGSGIVGSAVGVAQTAVGTGIELVGSIFGGLGRLVFGDGSASNATPNAAGRPAEAARPAQDLSSSNARVRTLGDQRRDEEDEAKKRGSQLYNGMGLNVQPRKDERKDD